MLPSLPCLQPLRLLDLFFLLAWRNGFVAADSAGVSARGLAVGALWLLLVFVGGLPVSLWLLLASMCVGGQLVVYLWLLVSLCLLQLMVVFLCLLVYVGATGCCWCPWVICNPHRAPYCMPVPCQFPCPSPSSSY